MAGKATPRTSPTTKAAAKKAATEPAAKKAPVSKAAAKKAATEPAAKKAPVSKAAAKKAPASKAAAKKAPASKAAAKKAPAATQVVVPAAPVPNAVPDSEWTRADLDVVRAELLAHMDRLKAELAVAEDQISELIRDAADAAGDDQADTGSKAFEREHGISLANNARELMQQTERALRRIDDGTYGRCEMCEREIGKGRLQAFPRATLCVSCKQQQERH